MFELIRATFYNLRKLGYWNRVKGSCVITYSLTSHCQKHKFFPEVVQLVS